MPRNLGHFIQARVLYLLIIPLVFSISGQVYSAAPYKTVEWIDLLPADDLEALSNPPSFLDDIEDGSPEDQAIDGFLNELPDFGESRYHQALVSTKVIGDLDNKRVRIPGFVVPLEFDDDQLITEFFLVPFFGACIHVPPPPPNQIIFVEFPRGLKLEALYDPFWVSGVLKTQLVENDIAISAYSLKMDKYEPYQD